MTTVVLALCLGLATPEIANAQSPMAPNTALLEALSSTATPRFEPRDVFSLIQTSDVQISPDGKRIAYVRSVPDVTTDSSRRAIWIVDVVTGAQTELGAGPSSSPRWSLDSRRLAYLAPDRNGETQVFVVAFGVGAGIRSQITVASDSPGDPAWSPDGRMLAFTMFQPDATEAFDVVIPKEPKGANWAAAPRIFTTVHYHDDGEGYVRPGHTQLYVAPSSGGPPRQVSSGPFDVRGPLSWSRDSRAILFSANRLRGRAGQLSFNSEIFQTRVSDGALSQLTHRDGVNASPVVSPDGRTVAYAGFDYDHLSYDEAHLYIMNADGTDSRRLDLGLDRDVRDVRWAADGRGIFISYGDQGEISIARIGLDGLSTVLNHNAAGPRFSVSDAGVVAFRLGSADRPADVAVVDGVADVRRLTRLNDSWLAPKTLGDVRPLSVKSSFDGEAIGAWIVTPPGYRVGQRYPTILWIHGGPYGDEGPQWMTDIQFFAAAGYVVLYSNPRGSTSYGFSFAHQLPNPVPGHDYDDLMSVVGAATDAGVADPGRLFVTGGSYGGLMAAWIVGKTDRFKAAVAEKPIINFTSETLVTDQYAAAELETGTLPWLDPMAIWGHSPLSLVARVKTPTMLMVGEDDLRTPVTEAEQFYDALQLRGVPTALVLFPGASHESLGARPSQRIAEAAVILQWFKRYGGL